MSEFPEHDKLAAVQAETQAIGDFLEWLQSQGVQLMIWRENLTDERPTDARCKRRRGDGPDHNAACEPQRPADDPVYNKHGDAYWLGHCTHWEGGGDCCRCGKGQHYEVTGISSFVHDGRSIEDLLAAWAGIDRARIETEKRAMLASLQQAART